MQSNQYLFCYNKYIEDTDLDWLKDMIQAIDYIENNICDEIDFAVAAKHVSCSTWEFQRIFSFVTHLSLSEYIRQRRLTLAALDIQTGKDKIIDVALRYGYDSPAAFSRAFSQLHGTTPSSVRNGDVTFKTYPRITFKFIMKEWYDKMSKFSERGYVIKETGPVYYTKDMDKTVKWFEEVLGWYSEIDQRNEDGTGAYGCVYNIPKEIEILHIAPFTGIHLFSGEPKGGMVAFMVVQGIESLYDFVKGNGWWKITDVKLEPWGSKTCNITTPDGYTLGFFQ